MTVKIRTRNI